MDEKCGCDICGEIPIKYNLTDKYMRNALVESGIKKWLFCDECVSVVNNFVDNLQALRPNKIVDNWPIPEGIADAADVTARERRARIDKKKKKSEYIRKDEFTDLAEKFWGFRGNVKEFMAGMKPTIGDLKRDIEKARKLTNDQYYDLVQEIGDLTRMINDRK